MPIYEYSCNTCHERFELLQHIGSAPPPCPACGATEVRKLVSATSFILKGSGWYKDLYGLQSSASSGDSGSSKPSPSTSSSSTAASADTPSAPAAAPAAPATPSASTPQTQAAK